MGWDNKAIKLGLKKAESKLIYLIKCYINIDLFINK